MCLIKTRGQIGPGHRVIISKDHRKILGLDLGDLVEIKNDGKKIIITKLDSNGGSDV